MWIASYSNGEATWSNEDPPYPFGKYEAEEFAQMFSTAKIMKISNRGGARRGAGRKKKTANTNRVLVTLDDAEFAAYKANGEGDWLRWLIRKHQGLCMHVNQLNRTCTDCGAYPAHQYEKM